MRLSTKGRYAVTAMVDIAQHSQGNPVALNEIAQRQEISLSYLEQLFSKLRRAGLVNSVRGPGGGYLLSRESDQIRISEIVLAVDTVFGPLARTNGSGVARSLAGRGTIANDLWSELDGVIAGFLHAITIGDVCSGRVRGFGESFANGNTYRAAAE